MCSSDLGRAGAETVSHLRQKRPGALFNQTFAEYLLTDPCDRL